MRNSIDVVERKVAHRRYAPKTRTGCFTCKIRRVKCDEARPFCSRCTSTGRKCDGYAVVTSPPSRNSPNTSSLTVALAFDVSTDALEKRTFDFFRSRTVPCVSGHFHDTVWDRIVLQVCHTEPAVRHAVHALGALHEERILRENADKGGVDVSLVQTSFPMKQYAKALSALQSLLNSNHATLDLIILCSLLCVHFEAFRENFTPAIVHAENAIRLLHASGRLNSKKVDPSLIAALLRIDIQGSLYLGLRIPGLPFFASTSNAESPAAFHDLTQARDILNTWTCRLFHFMRSTADRYRFDLGGNVPLEIIAKSQELEQVFVDLHGTLWDFMQKPSLKLTFREQHGVSLLRACAKMNRIIAACCVYTEATMYDAYLDDFDDILSMCKYVIMSENPDLRLFCVSIDEGLLHPLYFTATHCRDSRIRHDALAQLLKLKGNHDIWHVNALIKAAEHVIMFEESGCAHVNPPCSDIPEWRRVHSSGFEGWNTSTSGTVLKAHFQVRPNGMDGEWIDAESLIDIHESACPDLSILHELGDWPVGRVTRDPGLTLRIKELPEAQEGDVNDHMISD